MLPDRIARAQEFVWANARLLDRYRFAFHFRDGPLQPVLLALLAYQNLDGGFGNALEPDKRDPHSQPVDIQLALECLDEIDAFDSAAVGRVCDYLERISTKEGGTPFALPSANDFPHAPWWTVECEEPPPSLNPTAAIAGLLLKHDFDHRWVKRAASYCRTAIQASETVQFHDLMPMITFLEHVADQCWAKRELSRIAARVRKPGVVELDPHAGGYLHKPLDWAPSPESFCHTLFEEDVIALHLDALAERQQSDGGWPISWQPISKAVEIEWRGVVTINALRTLRAYGWNG